MLIAARAIQGLAAATLVPSIVALVFSLFSDERQRTQAMGITMSIFAGAAVGPLVGGVLLESFAWGFGVSGQRAGDGHAARDRAAASPRGPKPE